MMAAERAIGGPEIAFRDRGFIAAGDDLLFFREGQQSLLGLFETQFQLLELILKERFGVSIRLKALVEIGCDIGLAISIGDLSVPAPGPGRCSLCPRAACPRSV